MIRRLISKFNRSLSERLVPSRRRHTAPVRIWFEPDIDTAQNREIAKNMAVPGETFDLSRTGVAFLVSAIRINEKYFVGQDRKLNIEIDLPSGKVEMQVIGCRYEKVGIHLSMEKFLIGSQIVKIESDSIAVFDHFLRNGSGRKKSGQPGLELGLD